MIHEILDVQVSRMKHQRKTRTRQKKILTLKKYIKKANMKMNFASLCCYQFTTIYTASRDHSIVYLTLTSCFASGLKIILLILFPGHRQKLNIMIETSWLTVGVFLLCLLLQIDNNHIALSLQIKTCYFPQFNSHRLQLAWQVLLSSKII